MLTSITFWLVLLLTPSILFPITWSLYVFAVATKEARERLKQQGRDFHWLPKIFAVLFVLIGGICDAYMQLVTFTVLTFELPKYRQGEKLVSHRLQRTKHLLVVTDTSGIEPLLRLRFLRDRWARTVARHVCREWLEPYDAMHCRPPR